MTVPQGLQELDRWVCWRYGRPRPNGKRPKMPICATSGDLADITDSSTWGTYDEAVLMRPKYDGVGIVLGQGVAGIDLDNCVNAQTLEIEPWARRIVNQAQTYFEYSPSRTGVKGFGWGILPGSGKNRDVDGHSIEVYDQGRFFTVTGEQMRGTPASLGNIQPALDTLYNSILDAELVDKAGKAKNGAKFLRLWSGDWKEYPSPSEADLALLQFLILYSGDDDQIVRLWRKSGLSRDHLDSADYVERTLAKAKATHDTYTDSSNNGSAASAISDTTDAVSFLLSRVACPNECRSFIDAVIGASNGESVNWFDAPDLALGKRMIGGDAITAEPTSVGKRVQRHRKQLRQWQERSGYLLVECQPGGKDGYGNNHPTRYRLPLLAVAVRLLDRARTLARISRRPLKKELQEASRMSAKELVGQSSVGDRFYRPRRDEVSEFNRRLKSAVTHSIYCLDIMAEQSGYADVDRLIVMLRKSIEERRGLPHAISPSPEGAEDECRRAS